MNNAERTTRLSLAQDLLTDMQRELVQRESPKTALERLRRSALESLTRELGGLTEILGAGKAKLVFIGQVGVGKTTAICHLVGLTAVRQKRKKNKAGKESQIEVTEDLMATGGGFTTLCEVVVVPGTETSLLIDPFERAEVERTIDDFCLSVWAKVAPISAEPGEGGAERQINFPPELVRAVRNMVALPEGERKEDDAALRLAQDHLADGFDSFRRAVQARAGLDARVDTLFRVDAEHLADPRSWIKETFDGLNLARIATATIPRRITLTVERGLLCPEMEEVAALVDTKGVDASQFNREDLDGHIRNDVAALCILAERFENAPTNVLPVLQRHISPEAPISGYKFAVMVLPRSNEPERVVGGSGQVGDRDHGIALRRSQIEETLVGRGLAELGRRLMFFDPLLHYEQVGVDNKRLSDSTSEDVDAARAEAWTKIFDAITVRDQRVWERVSAIGDLFTKIKGGAGLDPAEEQLVRDARTKIEKFSNLNLTNADRFTEKFRGVWESGSRHTMVLRATNNRFGEYPARNIDIYYDAVPIAEELVRLAGTRPKDSILMIIRDVREKAAPDSALQDVLAVLETQIDHSFLSLSREVGRRMRDHLRSGTFAPQDHSNAFWVGVQNRFGQGPGFRDDVLSMYAGKVMPEEDFLAVTAETCWRSILVEPILNYLG